MSCSEVRERLSALLDEALPAAEQAACRVHVADCPECRRELERLRETVRRLGALPQPRAPEGLAERVLAAVRAGPGAPPPHPAPPGRLAAARMALFRPLRIKLPLQAAALLVVALGAAYVFRHTPELQQASRPEPLGSSDPGPAAVSAPRPAAPAPGPPMSPAPPLAPAPAEAPVPRPPAAARQPAVPASPPGRQEHRAGREAGEAEVLQERQEVPPAAAAPAPGARPAEPERARDASRLQGLRADTGRAKAAASREEASPDPAAASAPRAGEAPARLAAAPVRLSGRLVVGDVDQALQALSRLVSEAGGRELARRSEGGQTVVELALPPAGQARVLAALPGLGRWEPDPAAPAEGDLGLLTIRLAR